MRRAVWALKSTVYTLSSNRIGFARFDSAKIEPRPLSRSHHTDARIESNRFCQIRFCQDRTKTSFPFTLQTPRSNQGRTCKFGAFRLESTPLLVGVGAYLRGLFTRLLRMRRQPEANSVRSCCPHLAARPILAESILAKPPRDAVLAEPILGRSSIYVAREFESKPVQDRI